MSKKSTATVFQVDTEPTKAVVVSSLTKDISVEACIYDLIDNSIDAARDTIYKDLGMADKPTGLPDSYKGYHINLVINPNEFSISDNCGGIEMSKLKSTAMRFGQPSEHHMGIGIFGVGLNRALFKLGKISVLETDTGTERAEMTLDADKYLDDKKWKLTAQQLPSTGEVGTKIHVSAIPFEVSRVFGDKDSVEALEKGISWRYSRFIDKGLVIKVNKSPIHSHEIEIRDDGPYAPETKYYKTTEGVIVHLEFGQHSEHRFTAEPDYDKDKNMRLTEEYGWSIFCNDRAILLTDRTRKTGWDAKFHTEFYGFVGVVRFISDDASKLPWNTTKSDVDLNNAAYQDALIDMRQFAEKWRQIASDAKAVKRKGKVLTSPPKPASKKKKSKKSAATPSHTPTIKEDHNQFQTVLPGDIDEKNCFDKHLALVHEGKTLNLMEHSYAGAALIRMLFEISVLKFAERQTIMKTLIDFSIARRKKGGAKLTVEQEKSFSPTVEEMIAFLEQEPALWGANKHAHLKSSLSRLAKHKPLLNGVVHNAYQQVNRTEVFQIRDEALPLLRHLIET